MSLTIRHGDLFTTDAPALGHGVNVDGLMGAGIAAQFAARFPAMLEAYRAQCRSGALRPGGMFAWVDLDSGRWVYNLASQDRPGRRARLGWVESSARAALAHADTHGVPVVALPQIGCGIGGLIWEDVAGVLDHVQGDFDAKFEVWVYGR